MSKLMYILSFFLAIMLTIGSFFYQRPSAEIIQSGTECNVEQWMNCYQIGKSGGFPMPYIFDSLGVSVENKLGLEDDIRLVPFIFNIWVYFLLLIVTFHALKKSKECR